MFIWQNSKVNPLTPRVKPFDSMDRPPKAVAQYFTVVLFVNPLTPRVKPYGVLTSDIMQGQICSLYFHCQKIN